MEKKPTIEEIFQYLKDRADHFEKLSFGESMAASVTCESIAEELRDVIKHFNPGTSKS